MGYPGALGIDLSAEAGNFPAILKKVGKTIIDKGGQGRFGTWSYSFSFSTTAGLAQHAINVLSGKAELLNAKDFLSAYEHITPGLRWNNSFYTDTNTRVKNKKFILLYQDTYIMGIGYMHTPDVKVPAKYYIVK